MFLGEIINKKENLQQLKWNTLKLITELKRWNQICMSKFRLTISNTGELDLAELMITNKNPQWKKLRSAKLDMKKASTWQQYAVILKSPPHRGCSSPPCSLGSYLFSSEGPLGALERGSQEISDLCSHLTFIFENFQIPSSYFRIYWENQERSVFSYEKEGVLSTKSLFYEISNIRVAQTPWVVKCVIFVSQKWKISINCMIYQRNNVKSEFLQNQWSSKQFLMPSLRRKTDTRKL